MPDSPHLKNSTMPPMTIRMIPVMSIKRFIFGGKSKFFLFYRMPDYCFQFVGAIAHITHNSTIGRKLSGGIAILWLVIRHILFPIQFFLLFLLYKWLIYIHKQLRIFFYLHSDRNILIYG